MSRSVKKPYHAITCCESAKQDKQLAHRGERRAHKHALRTTTDFDDFTPPNRRECSWNNTYSWGRDGAQHYWPTRHSAEEVERITRK